MQERIAIVGTGALGGYIGGNLAHHGFDVTLIDMWPENLAAIRTRGLELDGVTAEEKFTVKSAKTLHLDDIRELGNARPVDIAFITVKSYDTERATKAEFLCAEAARAQSARLAIFPALPAAECDWYSQEWPR